ncbi:hypothetical protein [Candidatus Endoriftia persephonae]|jgi:hypothetical protein|uniref:Cytochrome C n=2 Tax=Gammaproteobacteria TaxID=1236 RepID=A0A9J6ZX36_9GAMM|nr:hypothetical protein [Candidatus Endoriftia persephone]EGW54728.1 putative cytochrome c family protein [endosymbiont of Tevnia jerichonana (vent Tica)]USF87253.1 cytochrome C [Candidatus Endoriftia persephone]
MNPLKTLSVALSCALLLTACGGESTSTDNGVPVVSGSHRVLAFNDLGMHCADLDYSNFVVLPPFNVVHSQVIERGATPRLLDNSEVVVTYKAQLDANGSITTTSQNPPSGSFTKSNFWDINPATGNTYVFDLFGINPQPDEGLTQQEMPGILTPYSANDAQVFNGFNSAKSWFSAEGIPILPVDDSGGTQAYPLMRVNAAAPSSGEDLASVDVVLPVASEADCQNCHAVGEVGARDSSIAFVFPDDITDPNSVLQAAKENILLLHDKKHGTNLHNQRPVLCARCHYSAALDLAGNGGPTGDQIGHDMMSQVMHGYHGRLKDPDTGADLFPADGTLEETCYQCHPGKITKCLRGAMGNAGIVCQNCHGDMLAIGGVFPLPDGSTRRPWIDEPRCESCHTGDALDHLGADIRLTQAWDSSDSSAAPRSVNNLRFAGNSAELYRNSLGHGGVACEGCHGSTHAIWPNAQNSSNDNVAATQIQGHTGTIAECATCHTSLPNTLDGPHGMHNVNSSSWDLGHEDFYRRNPNACKACHGNDLNGTVLSRAAADRDYQSDDDGGRTVHVSKGTEIGCTLCHARP